MNSDDVKKLVGFAIREQREKQGISQRKFALMIGTSQSHLYRIEAGKVDVGVVLLNRIADSLGIKARDLIGF